MATPNERRAAHAALAQVHREDVERRATHLAAATVDPDEEVASTLEAAAESVTRRGGAMVAVSWLTRAAEMSERSEERSRRLGDAAFVAGHAGLLGQAQQLVGADPAFGGSHSPASVVATAYVALYEDGDVRSTQRHVGAAIEELRDNAAPDSHEVLTRLINLLLAINQYAGDEASWERTHSLLDTLGDRVPAASRVYEDAWGDVVRRGAGVRASRWRRPSPLCATPSRGTSRGWALPPITWMSSASTGPCCSAPWTASPGREPWRPA